MKHYLVALLFSSWLAQASIIDTIKKATESLIGTAEIAVGVEAEKQSQKERLTKELHKFQKELLLFNQDGIVILDEIKNRITDLESQTKEDPKNEIVQKKLSLCTDIYQTIKDNKRIRERIITELEEFIIFIGEFLKDPYLHRYQKKNRLGDRLYYSFEDILSLYDMISDQKKQIDILIDQEKSARTEFESRKQSMQVAAEMYKKKKEQLNDLSRNEEKSIEYRQDISILEEQLYRYKREQEELRFKEIEIKASFIAMQLFLEKSRLEILQSYLKKTKPSIRVSELDLVDEREFVAKEKKKYFETKEQFRQNLDKIALLIKQKEQQLETIAHEYGVSLGRDVDTWTRAPEKSVSGYRKIYELASLSTDITNLKVQKELLLVREILLDKEFDLKEIRLDIKNSYYKIAGHQASEEIIEREIKKYAAPRARAKADFSRYADKAARIPDMLNEYKKMNDALITQRRELHNSKIIFKGKGAEYLRCLELLNKSEQLIKETIDILGQLTGYYSSVLAQTNSVEQLIIFIKDELSGSGGILSRPEYAITWNGFKNSITDIATFLRDIRSYVMRLTFSSVIKNTYIVCTSSFRMIQSLVGMTLVFLFLTLFYLLIPYLDYVFMVISSRVNGLLHIITMFTIMVMQFLQNHFFLISSWLLFYIFLSTQAFKDPYIYILFYLISIPYLLYAVHQSVVFCVNFNERNNYLFFSAEFQRRYSWTLSFLISTTVVIFFFRRSFILANYNKSELPKILSAINFIIFQTSLVLLLTKDLVLSLLPQSTTAIGLWIRDHIDRYYLLIQIGLFAIIVMSNPYVGFGKFVLYILLNIFYTTLLIGFLWWFYTEIKQIISRIFFLKNDEMVRERFSNAKTWFGISIVISFICFALIGTVVAARVWGWMITLQDFNDVINEPLMFKGTPDPVTFVSFIKVIGFIVGGFVASYALNRFVLTRIYDLFLVDSGVQHTVTSITRYIVFMITLLVGFSYVGLGQHIGYLLAALAVSIGWVLKDPINDFISYFIILVQRPIKIGDYVQIDQNTQGVVRKITPRSVILRRKNSTTLIIPNSYLIGQSIENWNYSRSFFALTDIFFTVDYESDPEVIQRIIFTVTQEYPNVLRNPKPIVRLEEFAEHGFVFLVRAYVSTLYVLEMWDMASDIRIHIAKTLRKNNIKIAVPVRVLRHPVIRHTVEHTGMHDIHEK